MPYKGVMNWFGKKEKEQGVPARAAVVPKHYNAMVVTNSVENNITVNSISTLSVTLRVLKPGETAKSLSKSVHGTISMGDGPGSVPYDKENCELVHFNAPNWMSVVLATEGFVYFNFIEVPVMVSPTTGKILSVDVDTLVREQEPNRQKASEIWGYSDGPFAAFHQLVAAPKIIKETAKELLGVPKDIIKGFKGLFKDEPVEPPLEAHMPEMSHYPPIRGISLDDWAAIQTEMGLKGVPPDQRDAYVVAKGFEPGAWEEANPEWNKRMMADWKLAGLYTYRVDQAKRAFNPE